MKTTHLLLLVTFGASLAACDLADSPPPPPTAEAQTPDPLPNSNVFSSDVKALQKAKDVQKTLNQDAAKTRQQINDQGG